MPKTTEDYELELREMRDRLQAEIQERVDRVPEQLQALGDVSRLPTHRADHDAEGVDAAAGTDQAQKTLLAQVDAALGRIDEGQFGQCVACGNPISAERLEAFPYSAFCIECERAQESKQG